jgi:hypothetical protein
MTCGLGGRRMSQRRSKQYENCSPQELKHIGAPKMAREIGIESARSGLMSL